MNIQIGGEVKVNRALLDVFGEMLSNPDRSLGLVRLRDERQIVLNGGGNGRFLGTATVSEAARLHRADYWHPGDLAEFNRDWQRELSVGGGWIERSYRSFTLGGESQRLRRFDKLFTTRYKLVQGERGELFHFCENLGIEAI